MRRTRTFISLLAVTVLWSDWRAEGDGGTGDANGVSASATATGSASITPPASTPDTGRSGLTAGTSRSPAEPRVSNLPPCAQAGPPVSLPPEFPKSFPLPPGTVITTSKHAGPTIVLEGFIPMELEKVRRFFVEKLPDAGFRLGRGEVERGEAESRFGGDGVAGFFKIRSIQGCAGALEFTVRVQSIESIRKPSPP
jgi:hypothetical protein